MDNETKMQKSTEKALKKLISEEIIAVDFYVGCLGSVMCEERKFIEEKFTEIMLDERDDHLQKLVKFARESYCDEFEVPFKYKDIEKYASNKCVSTFNKLKRGEHAAYYIEKAIEIEKDAIASYEEVLEDEWVSAEANAILLNIYYDEVQHLQELELLLQCCTMGVYLA